MQIIEENRGEYDEQRGKVVIALATKILAEAFYAVLVQTTGIQELKIVLQWSVSLSDLRLFTEAILKSRVVSLFIDGGYFNGSPVSDLLNSGRRYDPILQLMAKGQLQKIRLLNLSDFFGRVGNLSSVEAIPSLRALDLSYLQRGSYGMLQDLLKKCTGLQRLTISHGGVDVAELLKVCRRLLELVVIYGPSYIYDVRPLTSQIAKLKEQCKEDDAENSLRLQSLVFTEDKTFKSAPMKVSVTFSKDGIAGISTNNGDKVNLKLFTSEYGWALLDPDLVQFQLSENQVTVDEWQSLDYEAWSRSTDKHGRVPALVSLRFDGSLLSEKDRPALLSIIDKSPKMERLAIVLDSDIDHLHDREVFSWHLEHLASKISMLELSGYACINTVVDFITRNNISLPKLTEFRWNSKLCHPGHLKMTKERWCQLFAAMDFSVLTTLAIDMETSEDFWCALLDTLPKDGLLIDGTLVALTLVELILIMDEEEQLFKHQQLSERVPLARLIIRRPSPGIN